MLIDGRFSVAAPAERVLSNLFDARLMAECLPGCESLEALANWSAGANASTCRWRSPSDARTASAR